MHRNDEMFNSLLEGAYLVLPHLWLFAISGPQRNPKPMLLNTGDKSSRVAPRPETDICSGTDCSTEVSFANGTEQSSFANADISNV